MKTYEEQTRLVSAIDAAGFNPGANLANSTRLTDIIDLRGWDGVEFTFKVSFDGTSGPDNYFASLLAWDSEQGVQASTSSQDIQIDNNVTAQAKMIEGSGMSAVRIGHAMTGATDTADVDVWYRRFRTSD